jgi:hypothetical protein
VAPSVGVGDTSCEIKSIVPAPEGVAAGLGLALVLGLVGVVTGAGQPAMTAIRTARQLVVIDLRITSLIPRISGTVLACASRPRR